MFFFFVYLEIKFDVDENYFKHFMTKGFFIIYLLFKNIVWVKTAAVWSLVITFERVYYIF